MSPRNSWEITPVGDRLVTSRACMWYHPPRSGRTPKGWEGFRVKFQSAEEPS
jgi:hypothetical protein